MIGTARQRILRAMRRALVLIALLAACLPAAVPQTASAVGFSIEHISLKRQVGEYTVYVQAEDEGKGATLAVERGHSSVVYATPDGGLEGKAITARFGRLGSLRLTLDGPVHHAQRCGGRSETQGTFKGEFEFHGEGGYLDFDLHSMPGEVQVVSDRCPPARPSRPVERGAKEPSATLSVQTTGPPPAEFFAAIGEHTNDGRFSGAFYGGLVERRERLVIQRTIWVRLAASQFRWNLKTGAATVRPPAPFSGRLNFHRHPKGGAASVTGTLRGPTLAGPELTLAGKHFKATLTKELPYDE
jgi:hypothetical protein